MIKMVLAQSFRRKSSKKSKAIMNSCYCIFIRIMYLKLQKIQKPSKRELEITSVNNLTLKNKSLELSNCLIKCILPLIQALTNQRLKLRKLHSLYN